MNKTLKKYNKNMRIKELTLALRDWQRVSEYEKRIEEMK
jgi:hypothetical protein